MNDITGEPRNPLVKFALCVGAIVLCVVGVIGTLALVEYVTANIRLADRRAVGQQVATAAARAMSADEATKAAGRKEFQSFLDSNDSITATQAASCLPKLAKDPFWRDAVFTMSEGHDGYVRHSAASALKELGTLTPAEQTMMMDRLQSYPNELVGLRAFEALLSQRGSETDALKLQAANLLTKSGFRQSKERAEKYLATTQPTP